MRRLLAGDRRVWLAGGAVLAVSALAMFAYLLKDSETYIGTNSVGVRGVVADVQSGQRLCVHDFVVPDGTGRVQMAIGWTGERRPALEVVLRAGREVRRGTVQGASVPAPTGPVAVDIPVREIDTAGASEPGHFCVTPTGAAAAVGGAPELQADQQPALLDGKPLAARVALRFLAPDGESRSLLFALPNAIERAALLRPGFVDPWLYALIFVVLLPALALVSLRLMAMRTASAGGVRSAVAIIAAVAFLNATAWALITPAWHGPDEPDHFAYAQSVAERGEIPDREQSHSLPFSSRSVVALDAARTYSVVGLGDARPPWLSADEAHYRALLARNPGREDDGGGYLSSTSSHLPGYYLLTVPAYAVADSGGTFSELTAMRLVSALLAARRPHARS